MFEIVDWKRLSRLLRTVIDRLYAGSQSACAKAIRIGHRSQLSKLVHGLRRRMDYGTFQALTRLRFSETEAAEFRLCIRWPEDSERERRALLYEQWMTAELRGAWRTGGIRRAYGELVRTKRPSYRLQQLLERRGWREQRETVFERDEPRWGLSFARIMRPLLQAARSGGVERDVEELSDDELDEYLAGALQAELVLLRRPPAFRRIMGPEPDPNRRIPRLRGTGPRAVARAAREDPKRKARFAEQEKARRESLEKAARKEVGKRRPRAPGR